MTLNNTNIRIVKNEKNYKKEHHTETMALLKKLLDDAGMNQAQLAQELNRDKTTINRWSNDSREITFENAKKIAAVLNCHPIDVYQPSLTVNLYLKCSWDGYTKDVSKDEQIKIKLPYEFSTENTKAVLMDSPGTPSDGEVWLFDLNKVKKIHKNVIGKICYITASNAFKKANNKKISTSVWHPLIAMIAGAGNGKMKIVNSYTGELLNPLCDNLTYDDLEYAVPVKARYDPDLTSLLK